MGERFPPGRWWASDGNWYPAELRPAMPTWVAVDGAERCGCGRQVSAGIRWWDPGSGVLCRACTVREGVGSPPPGPAPDTPTVPAGAQPVETLPPADKGASPSVVGQRWSHQTIARLRLQRDGECCDCGVAVLAERWAGWDRATKVVVCEDCLDQSSVGLVGSPGSSAAMESERLREERLREALIIWGDEAAGDGIESADERAYRRGSDGERRLGPMLDWIVRGHGYVLHDRAVGRNANIDHLVVVPSGVWVVDSKNYRGAVRARRSTLFGPATGVRVGSRDQSDTLLRAKWQLDPVRSAVDDPRVPVRLMLAFPSDAAFSWFTKSFEVDGVWCCPPSQIERRLSEPAAVLTHHQVTQLTGQLSVRLPART